jgi:DNA modification methylase
MMDSDMNSRFTNTLFTGDNLFILHGMNSETVDLIYLDPPFNSKRTYSAPIGSKAAGATFKDMWTWDDVSEMHLENLIANYPALGRLILSAQVMHGKAMAAYLAYMGQRIVELHRILKSTGSLYLHCDPTASHYLKALLDVVFGRENFRNEIIWCYRKWAVKQHQFVSNHDVIFFYSKSENNLFNTQFAPLSPGTMKRWKGMKQQAIFDDDGNRSASNEDSPSKGSPMADWWEISILNPASKERTGYPTQKPLALMHRIIQASSNPGDLVLDPFCGCATTCVAAQQLGRKWIGIDIEKQANKILLERLSDDAGMFSDFVHRTDIPKRSDIEETAPSEPVKKTLFKSQGGACKGCGTEFEIRHFEIDHIVPRAKGGGDYLGNYQLLCGSCNRIKGDRPMTYLMMRLKTIERDLEKTSFGE